MDPIKYLSLAYEVTLVHHSDRVHVSELFIINQIIKLIHCNAINKIEIKINKTKYYKILKINIFKCLIGVFSNYNKIKIGVQTEVL